MIEMLAPHQRKSVIYNEMFDAESHQVELFVSNVDDLQAQMDVNTATWALEIYEKELSIPVNKSKPIEERRSVIKSRMRGAGQVDAALLKIVADSYTNGDCDVGFNGIINITFNSQVGRPPNLDDVKQAIEDTKPAHLNVQYSFRHLTISEVRQMTIGEVSQEPLGNFAGGEA